MHTDKIYSHGRYDVIVYFGSEVIAKNCRKYRFRRLRAEFIENGSSEGHQIFSHFSRTICHTNLSDMPSLALYDRLQNATKYCTKVRKMRPAEKRIE